MASIITATTTSGLTQSADNSGVLQLASGVGNLVTVPAVTGTAMVSGAMPAFSAYLGTTQSVTSGANTKVQLTVKNFDTANAFDNVTNYRFQPTVAGYYQLNASIRFIGTTLTEAQTIIYKNNASLAFGNYSVVTAQSALFSVASTLVFMNGSTDYVELFGYVVGTSPTFNIVSSTNTAVFSGLLVRGS